MRLFLSCIPSNRNGAIRTPDGKTAVPVVPIVPKFHIYYKWLYIWYILLFPICFLLICNNWNNRYRKLKTAGDTRRYDVLVLLFQRSVKGNRNTIFQFQCSERHGRNKKITRAYPRRTYTDMLTVNRFQSIINLDGAFHCSYFRPHRADLCIYSGVIL